MAQDNPFLSLFESMGTGMEAGAERRSLMQRAERGQLEPGEEVPGLGRTILKGITRAATPANTRLAQDQLKLQAANYALQNSIREKEYNLRQQNQILDEAEYSAKLQQSIDDNMGYRSSTVEMQSMLNNQNLRGLRTFVPPKGMSQSAQEELFQFRDGLLNSEQGKRFSEMAQMRESLAPYYPSNNIPNTYAGLKKAMDSVTSMESKEEAKAALETGAEILGDPKVTGLSLNIKGLGQVYLSDKKEDAETEFPGMSDAEIQRKYLGLSETDPDEVDDKQAVTLNLQWLREEATKRGLSLPEAPDSTLPKGSLLDAYRNRQTRLGY